MASTYVNNLRVAEPADGDSGWGTSTNTSLELIGEALGIGTEAITTNADTHTSTVADGTSDQARAFHLKYTGTLDSNCTITIGPNTMKRVQIIENATSGGYSIIISQGSGDNVTILAGPKKIDDLDAAGGGAAVVDITTASFGSQAFYVPAGSTGNRPTGVAGAFRYNSTTSEFEGYTDSWGSIGGSGATNVSLNEFSGNGSTTAFTLSADPSSENNTQAYIDGVYQEKGTYAVSGTTLTFSTAPPNGSSIEVMAFTASSIGTPSDDTVSTAKIVNDAVTQAKIADDAVGSDQLEGSLTVDINGGTVDGAVIGGSSAAAGSFTTLTASSTFTLGGTAVTSTAAELNILDGVTATATELNYLDITTLGTTQASKAVTADANGVVKFDNGIQEESTVLTSGTTVALDLNAGTVFTITLAHNIGTFNWTNPASSGYASMFLLQVTQDGTGGRTISWPAAVDWASATAPTLSSGANDVDTFVFYTVDGGTTYFGFTAGQDLS